MKKRGKAREKKWAPSAQYITGDPGPTITMGSKVWRLGFNTQNAKGRLEELIRTHVVRDALKLRGDIGGEAGEQYWQDARDALAAEHYHTFEKGWFRVLKSNVGNRLFLLSLLQKHHPDATEADALALLTQESEQTEQAMAVVSPTFICAAARQIAIERGAAEDKADAIAKTMTEMLQAKERAPATDSA